MVAQAVETYSKIPSGPVPLLWHRLVAHADITLIMPDIPEDETLQSVVITADKSVRLTGAYTLDLESWELKPDESGQGSNEIVIKTDNLSVEGGRLNVWASICPCHISSLDIRIETDRHAYVKHVPSCDLTFKANVRGILSVDMSSAEAEVFPDEEELNASVNQRVFDMLDLDLPGLHKVKEYHLAGRPYMAAQALLEYWRTDRGVNNPNVNLNQTSFSSAEKEKADMALKENGYRFFVKNYDFQSFADGKGSIDWTKELPGETQFNIQKHRHQWTLQQAKVYWGTKDE